MGLKNLSLKDHSASMHAFDAPLGTNYPLAVSPVAVQGGVQLFFETDPDLMTRRTVTFRSKPAVFDPKTHIWSKFKRSMAISGAVDVGGTYQANAIRIELDTAANSTDFQVIELLNNAALALLSPEASKFWTKGTPEL